MGAGFLRQWRGDGGTGPHLGARRDTIDGSSRFSTDDAGAGAIARAGRSAAGGLGGQSIGPPGHRMKLSGCDGSLIASPPLVQRDAIADSPG